MVDIDAVVCDFCAAHLPANAAAFADPRLTLIVDDAAAQLEKAADGAFDVIIGDLADPVSGGPCFHLYTREFYEGVIKKKLAPGGVFVTQSGPAGVLSAGQVFSCQIWRQLWRRRALASRARQAACSPPARLDTPPAAA